MLLEKVEGPKNGMGDVTALPTSGCRYNEGHIASSDFVLRVIVGDLGKGKRNVTTLLTSWPARWWGLGSHFTLSLRSELWGPLRWQRCGIHLADIWAIGTVGVRYPSVI